MAMSKRLVVFAMMLGTFGGPASGQSSKQEKRASPSRAPAKETPVQEWRVLLIIKKSTDITMEGLPRIEATIPDDNVQAVTRAFREFTPRVVSELSHGRLRWAPNVVVSPVPLERVARSGDSVWVSPQEVQEDYERYVETGQYDGVFVYWRGIDDATGRALNGGFGWSVGRSRGAKWAGHTCVHFGPTPEWTADSDTTDVFLHEWLHQVEAFAAEHGVPLPKDRLHEPADKYGLGHNSHGLPGWRAWYEAFINGTIRERDGTRVGLGDATWSLGTIREAAAIYREDFLTPDRRKANLLVDGSFERDDLSGWPLESFQKNSRAVTRDRSAARSGSTSLRLAADSTRPDDAIYFQEVTVKPGTQYLFGGYVRTRDVTFDSSQSGPVKGANLSLLGAYESSEPVAGTADWRYVSLVFNSGDQSTVKVGPRLGHWGCAVSGEANFDDLVLIELPSAGIGASRTAPPVAGSRAVGR